MDFRFRPEDRIRRSGDFRRAFDRRRSAADGWLIVYACENGLDRPRLGLSVSRKFGPAHHRNRLRRLYREAFRLTRQELPAGVDLVLVPRTAEPPALAELQQSLARLAHAAARKLGREVRPS
jgi:ribonuclease P protein component